MRLCIHAPPEVHHQSDTSPQASAPSAVAPAAASASPETCMSVYATADHALQSRSFRARRPPLPPMRSDATPAGSADGWRAARARAAASCCRSCALTCVGSVGQHVCSAHRCRGSAKGGGAGVGKDVHIELLVRCLACVQAAVRWGGQGRAHWPGYVCVCLCTCACLNACDCVCACVCTCACV